MAGLFKLLGSHDPDDRLRFWEIFKGITTPAEFAHIENQLTAINALVTQAELSTKTLVEAAKITPKTGH
jgi:UDP-N-acetylmuramyl tripeptide synthase